MSAESTLEIPENVRGIHHLILKGRSKFIAQIQACHEEEDKDAREELKRLQNPPCVFSDALKIGTVICRTAVLATARSLRLAFHPAVGPGSVVTL